MGQNVSDEAAIRASLISGSTAKKLATVTARQPSTAVCNAYQKIKQVKGKANEVIGAARGNTAQEIKGKAQKAVGKAQEKLGKSRARKDANE